MLKLYSHPNSIYARRVRIAAIEKGIDLPLEHVAMEKRAHKKRDYLKLNPYGRVPTLQHDDMLIYETGAILLYLEELYPEPSLMPKKLIDRAHVWRHLILSDRECGHAGLKMVFAKRFLPEERWDREDMAKSSKQLSRHFNILSEDLGEKSYLTGDQLTLADIGYIPFLHFRHLMGFEMAPNLERWSRELLDRESARRTIPDA